MDAECQISKKDIKMKFGEPVNGLHLENTNGRFVSPPFCAKAQIRIQVISLLELLPSSFVGLMITC